MIDPEVFEHLVARITAETPLSDDAFANLLDDSATYACASELDVIWNLVGTLEPPSLADPSA